MKTLHTNATLAKHIAVEVLGAVHAAVEGGEVLTNAEGGMKFSLVTGLEHVGEQEKKELSYLLPAYFK